MDTGSIPVWSTIWESSYIVVCYLKDRGIEVIPDTSHNRHLMANFRDDAASLRVVPTYKNNGWSQAIAAPALNALMHMPVWCFQKRMCRTGCTKGRTACTPPTFVRRHGREQVKSTEL